MKLVNKISEDEVIAEFLKAEINSKRFSNSIIQALKNHKVTILTNPNTKNKEENVIRKSILGVVRGYGENRDLFENFPTDVTWYRAIFSKEDLTKVMYIDYSYWNELSNHSRLPIIASKNIVNDVQIYGVSNDVFREIYSEIRQEKTFPKLIFVACNENSRIVILEGHARLTAYFLDSTYIPQELEVFIGYSEKFESWDLY